MSAWAVTAGLVGLGWALNATAEVPTQESVRSAIDPATGVTRWMTGERTPWGRELNALPADETVTDVPAAPQARILADRATTSGRTLTMQVRSPRGGTVIQLIAHQARITGLRVEGRSAPVAHHDQIQLVGVPDAGLRVDLELADIEPGADLEVTDWTHDVTSAGGYRPPPPDVTPVTPIVAMTGTVALSGG